MKQLTADISSNCMLKYKAINFPATPHCECLLPVDSSNGWLELFITNDLP